MSTNTKRKEKRKEVPHHSVYKDMGTKKQEEERLRRSQQTEADRIAKKSEKNSQRQKKPRGKNRDYLQGKT